MADGTLKVGTITNSAGSGNIAIGSGVTVNVNRPAFAASISSSQSITASTFTKIQFDNEIFDTNNAYDNSTNYRFTPQTAGKYFIYGQVTSASSTDMDRCMSGIYLNGSRVSQTNSFNGDSSSAHTATIVSLNGSSDYVELYGYFGISTSTDLQGRACFFGGYKLID
jgi:hypothetical protein